MNVVVREFGGLGNQLFQYAAAKYYARRYGAAMRIATDPAWNAKCNGYPRPCLLSHFSITAPLAERSVFERMLFTDKRWLQPAAVPFKNSLHLQVFVEQPEHRYRFLRDLPLERDVETLYLVGYFQSNLLVEEVGAEVRADLTLREPPTGKNLELLQLIERSINPVSLHVRRGDATLPAEGRVVLPLDYFSQAIATMRERLADPVFLVFSDDKVFVKANLPRDKSLVFVDHNNDFSAHEDLRLMSSCHHHIIANSTFSWWAAWLNPRPDKIVIAPRRWFVDRNERYHERLPKDWIVDDFVAAETFA